MSHSKKDHRRSAGGHSISFIESGHCGQMGSTKAWRKFAKRRHTREMRRESNRITSEALELFFADVEDRWTEYDIWGNPVWGREYEDGSYASFVCDSVYGTSNDLDDHDIDDYDLDDYDLGYGIGEDFGSYGSLHDVGREGSIQAELRGYSLSDLIEAVRRKEQEHKLREMGY